MRCPAALAQLQAVLLHLTSVSQFPPSLVQPGCLQIGEHQRRAEVVAEGRWERTSLLPLRTTNLDATAGFYSHRLGYTPFGWSFEPVEQVQLGRVTRIRRP